MFTGAYNSGAHQGWPQISHHLLIVHAHPSQHAVQQPVQTTQWQAPSALDNTLTPAWHHTHPTLLLQMHDLRTNPHPKAAAEGKVDAMEQAATPFAKCKVFGRYNYKEAMKPNPLVRYSKARPSFDDLTHTQFVGGVLATVQDLSLPMFKDAMINKLKETMHLSSTVCWLIAKAAYREVMTKIEQGRIGWDNPDGLWHAKMEVNQMHAWGKTGYELSII